MTNVRVPLYEIVPNFTDNGEPALLEDLQRALSQAGARVLSAERDADHARMVITAVGPRDSLLDGALAAIDLAARRVDVSKTQGAHPRVGACDVMPVVPLTGTMDEAVDMARDLAQRVWRELNIPVYLYENAALKPERRNLAHMRNIGFESLRDAAPADPRRAPDIGGPALHPTAGAVCVGARGYLVAFNVNLDTTDLDLARDIAREVREANGGLPGVKALGFALASRSLAQVSMNLVDPTRTGPLEVFEAVRALAEKRGVGVHSSELVGLIPREVLSRDMRRALRLEETPRAVEDGLPPAEDDPAGALVPFLSVVGARTPAPGGGAVAALVGALGAALGEMAARYSRGKQLDDDARQSMDETAEFLRGARRDLHALITEDTRAFQAIAASWSGGSDPEKQRALETGARVPLRVMALCADIAERAVVVVRDGNPNLAGDARIAVDLSAAALDAARHNVAVNARGLTRRDLARELLDEARLLARRARDAQASLPAPDEDGETR